MLGNAIIILNIVQLGGQMNNSRTTKEAILVKIREIVARDGLNALNIRALAKELGCSVGIIYYYFPSKDELIVEAIESVWEDIFQVPDEIQNLPFSAYMNKIFINIAAGIKKYPNFFTLHTIMLQTDEKSKAKSMMHIYMTELKNKMKEVLDSDKTVKKSAFTEFFTEDDLISFIMSNIMSLILDPSYKKDFFIKLIDKILY